MRKDIYWQKALGKNLFIGYVFVEFFYTILHRFLCINLLPSFTLQSINTIHITHIHCIFKGRKKMYSTKKAYFRRIGYMVLRNYDFEFFTYFFMVFLPQALNTFFERSLGF